MSARRLIAGMLVSGAIALASFAQVSGDASARRAPYPKQLPPGEPLELIESKCLMCHSAMLITQQRKDSTGWEKTVHQMEQWGARIVPTDHDRVVAYFLKNFGPSTGATKSPRSAPGTTKQ